MLIFKKSAGPGRPTSIDDFIPTSLRVWNRENPEYTVLTRPRFHTFYP